MTRASKLPQLLASLPREGLSALVRPTKWPSNSFYKVVRSKIRFQQVEGGTNIKPYGKAFGQLFWKGRAIPSRKIVDKIPNGLKTTWTVVERDSLPAETLEAIGEADKVVASKRAAHEALVEITKQKRAQRAKEAEAKAKEAEAEILARETAKLKA